MGQEREWTLEGVQRHWAQFRASAGVRGIHREVSKGSLDYRYHRMMVSHREMLIDTGPRTFFCCIVHSPCCICQVGGARLPASSSRGEPSSWGLHLVDRSEDAIPSVLETVATGLPPHSVGITGIEQFLHVYCGPQGTLVTFPMSRWSLDSLPVL